MSTMKISNAQVEKFDLDYECQVDLATGKGIRLQSVDSFRKSEKIDDGLQSPFFGTDFQDEEAFSERWRCKCGYQVGRALNGKVCPKCDTVVEYVDVDISRCGWIIIDHFKVMSPIFAQKLQEALGTFEGEKVLSRIIYTDYLDPKRKRNTKMHMSTPEKEEEMLKKHPFTFKGMTWLAENIKEVLDFYEPKKPTKAKLFKELRADSDKMFTHSIPVFSSVLRIESPGEKDKKYYKPKINKFYQALIRCSNRINEFGEPDDMNENERVTVDRYLYQMHSDILDLFTEIFNILNGKKGVIASRVIAGRYNFSTRMIISASSGELRSDEIEMCYIGFMELFRYELINTYSKMMGCTIIEGQNAWKRALIHFNDVFYGIMCYMIENDRDHINVIINRNPSINYGSFLTMKIKGVKKDINDKTMRLNTRVIKTMAADFDGDQLNVFRIIGDDLGKRFSKNMNPRYNLFIDNINGRVNSAIMPIKDEVVGFYSFNTI